MSHNADAIVHELHVEFESMLSYVKDSRTPRPIKWSAGCSGAC